MDARPKFSPEDPEEGPPLEDALQAAVPPPDPDFVDRLEERLRLQVTVQQKLAGTAVLAIPLDPVAAGEVRAARARLAAQSSRYLEHLRDSEAIAFVWDTPGQFALVGEGFENLVGYTQEELLLLGLPAVLPASGLAAMRQSVTRGLTQGESDVAIPLELMSRGGRPVRVEITARIKMLGGAPETIVGEMREINGADNSYQAPAV